MSSIPCVNSTKIQNELFSRFGQNMIDSLMTNSIPVIQKIKNNVLNNTSKTYDFFEEPDKIYILYRVPGIDKKNISVLLLKGQLVIKAKTIIHIHKTHTIEYNDKIKIPENIAKSNLSVSYHLGLLKIIIDKKNNYDKIDII